MMRISRTLTALVGALALAWSGAGAASAAGGSFGPNLSCGEVISASVTLTANLHCIGTALIVDADNDVTLDLGGHTVSGDGTGDGIVMSSSDVPDFKYTVQDGRVSDFATCVDAGNATVADVTDVRITGCPNAVELSQGLIDFDLSDSRITTATTDLLYDPAELRDINSVDVTGSTIIGGTELVTTSFGEGYYNKDRIINSPVTFNTVGNDVISNNVFVDSPVQENGFDELQITDNTFEDAPTGIVDNSLGGDTITGNTFKDNGLGAALHVASGPTVTVDDSITDNRFIDNGASGLYIDAAGDLATSSARSGCG
jgi:hypothetical protein